MQKSPAQGKTCNLSRSLRSFHSVGMTCREDALPLPMGEVAECSEDGEGQRSRYQYVTIQKNTVRPSQSRLCRASSPIGRAKGRGRFRLSTRVVFGTFHGDESSPLHCVVPFNPTGYLCCVEGGYIKSIPKGYNNCQLFIVNSTPTVNCQLLSVHPPGNVLY